MSRRCESCHDANDGRGAGHRVSDASRPALPVAPAMTTSISPPATITAGGCRRLTTTSAPTATSRRANCDFDASIKGAHVVPRLSQTLCRAGDHLTKVTNGTAGKPTGRYVHGEGQAGAPIPLSAWHAERYHGRPDHRLRLHQLRKRRDHAGYVSESAVNSHLRLDGTCTYTFTHAVPANATGTYTIGIEARRTETCSRARRRSRAVTYGATNQVM